jgi:trans-aconitate methyltransferase
MKSSDVKATYNAIAEQWSQDHSKDVWWHKGADAFASMLKPGAKVLDMGCGVGWATNYLAGHGLNVQGLDFSDGMIAIAKRQFPALQFGIQDIYEADKIAERFDAIYLQAVLLHIPKNRVQEVLAKLASLLNPGGLLYIAVKEASPTQPDEVVKTEVFQGKEYQRPFSNFSIPELIHLLQDAGLHTIWDRTEPGRTSNWIQVVGAKL